MPVGITEGASPSETSLRLSHGDTVIMVSDGIASDSADGKWIAETLQSGLYSGTALAEKIKAEAVKKGVHNDDKTVLVLEIERFVRENSEGKA